MKVIKDLKKMWVCFNSRGEVVLSTVKHSKRESITELISGSGFTWKEVQKFGWECHKVNIEFTIIK